MSDYTKGLLITFLGVLVISPDVLLIRLIDAGTFTVLFWRSTLSGCAILGGYLICTSRRALGEFSKIGVPGAIITVVFSLGTFCFLYSVTHTSAANTLLISATAPVFAALMSIVFLSERIPLRTLRTIAGALAGMSVIGYSSMSGRGGNIVGDLAAVLGAMSMAATFTIARARKSASMVPAMGLAGFLTGAGAALVAPTLAVPSGDILWAALLGLIVVPVGFGLLTTGPRYIPAPNVSLILLLVWWFIDENPGGNTLAGGAVILAALAMGFLVDLRRQWGQRKSARQAQTSAPH